MRSYLLRSNFTSKIEAIMITSDNFTEFHLYNICACTIFNVHFGHIEFELLQDHDLVVHTIQSKNCNEVFNLCSFSRRNILRFTSFSHSYLNLQKSLCADRKDQVINLRLNDLATNKPITTCKYQYDKKK